MKKLTPRQIQAVFSLIALAVGIGILVRTNRRDAMTSETGPRFQEPAAAPPASPPPPSPNTGEASAPAPKEPVAALVDLIEQDRVEGLDYDEAVRAIRADDVPKLIQRYHLFSQGEYQRRAALLLALTHHDTPATRQLLFEVIEQDFTARDDLQKLDQLRPHQKDSLLSAYLIPELFAIGGIADLARADDSFRAVAQRRLKDNLARQLPEPLARRTQQALESLKN